MIVGNDDAVRINDHARALSALLALTLWRLPLEKLIAEEASKKRIVERRAVRTVAGFPASCRGDVHHGWFDQLGDLDKALSVRGSNRRLGSCGNGPGNRGWDGFWTG